MYFLPSHWQDSANVMAKSCQYDGKRGYNICVNIELRIGSKKIIKVGYKGLKNLYNQLLLFFNPYLSDRL